MTSFKEASERFEGRSKNGTSSKTEQQKFLINMPCKYHKKGICKLGKSCRFLHANQKTKKTPTVNLPTTAEKTVCVQISKFGRRPFLQLVVLYASDTRVSKYADEILEILLDAGIDVVVQNTIQPGGSPQVGTKVPKAKDIKAEHLAELICTSHADFLIVVGDKNMKNRSCQAKRKGKLLEMMVEDVISLIWKSWPQNPHKTLARIKSLTTEQTTSLLFQYCGPKHISDRFEYLCTLKKEILSSYKIGSWCDSLEDKLSNLQKCAITLHKQLKKAMKVLSELAVQVENPELSRGSVKTFEYKPSACRTPKSTIAYPLQIHLYCFIVDMMKSIEGTFDSLRLPTSLWNEYYVEHVGNWNVNYEELQRVREEMWKALEEHEKSLLDQEQAEKSEGDGEEGMFSDLNDADPTLMGELEPDSKASSADDDDHAASEESSSSESEEAASPVKFPFSFPMPTTAIFTPSPSASSDKSDKIDSPPLIKKVDREQTSTPPVGLGRGTVGFGRASPRPSIDASDGTSSRLVGLGRGMSRDAQRPDSISSGRRGSTGGLELPGEFGLGQRREWPGRGPASMSPRDNSGPFRRVSDLGVARSALAAANESNSLLDRSLSDAKSLAEESLRQRNITKEEMIALQLDRQLERRLELERQLEREREVERELERQLEKRKQKGEFTGRSSVAEVDTGTRLPVGQRRDSRDLRDARDLRDRDVREMRDVRETRDIREPKIQPSNSYNPFALPSGSPSVPPLQSPRRPSYVATTTSVTPPPPGLSPPPPGRRMSSFLSQSHDEEYRPPSRRESVSSMGFSPFGQSDTPISSARSSFSQPHFTSFPDLGKSASLTSVLHERTSSFSREVGTPEIETRSSRSSSNASPRSVTPGFPDQGSLREPLFPSSVFGSLQGNDPFYQEISKIWGQNAHRTSISSDRPFEDSSSDIDEGFGRPPSPPLTNLHNEESSYEFKDDESESRRAASPRRMLSPKLTLQHGFVLKPDPVAST